MDSRAPLADTTRRTEKERALGITDLELRAMDGKAVNVCARDGAPVSLGRFQLSATDGTDVTQRLDLHFETELMRCVMRVPLFRLRSLLSSWDGERYHYDLPASAQVWRKASAPPLTSPPQPIVETFGMPATAGRPAKESPTVSQR